MWSDVLDLPLEMQQEARFTMDSYVMGLHRQINPYYVAPYYVGSTSNTHRKGAGKGKTSASRHQILSTQAATLVWHVDPWCNSKRSNMWLSSMCIFYLVATVVGFHIPYILRVPPITFNVYFSFIFIFTYLQNVIYVFD